MNGIILAAGRGSRVNQSSKNKPKGMFLYKNKTLIDHILENFKKTGIKFGRIPQECSPIKHENSRVRTVIPYGHELYTMTLDQIGSVLSDY